MLRGVIPASLESVVVDVDMSVDRVLEGYCVILLIALILFEVTRMSLSDGLGGVVGLGIDVVVE